MIAINAQYSIAPIRSFNLTARFTPDRARALILNGETNFGEASRMSDLDQLDRNGSGVLCLKIFSPFPQTNHVVRHYVSAVKEHAAVTRH